MEALDKFISHCVPSKDIHLLIAQNNNEFFNIEETLKKHKYHKCIDINQFIDSLNTYQKIYLTVDNLLDKTLYDFICQYPTGQISLSIPEKGGNISINPDYKSTSILILITKENLFSKVEKDKFTLLDKVGMVFQTDL